MIELKRTSRTSWPAFTVVGAFALFISTCCSLIPFSRRLADPMTNVPLRTVRALPFPVLVMAKSGPRVDILASPHAVLAGDGESFLVPPGQESAVEKSLNLHHRLNARGSWALRVRTVTVSVEDVELYWI